MAGSEGRYETGMRKVPIEPIRCLEPKANTQEVSQGSIEVL